MKLSGMSKVFILSVLLTFGVGLGISTLLANLDIERRASGERSAALSELAAVRAQLEGVVKATFNSTDGLVHLVAINSAMGESLFAQMASLAIGKNPHIRNIALAPDDVVKYVWPLAGNESAVDFAYRTSPEQYTTILKARQAHGPVLAGPVDLIQGGRGFINRAPVFLEGNLDHYWGVVSIVAHVDSLLTAGGVTSNDRFLIALRGKDGKGSEGEIIVGESFVFAEAPVIATVPIPGGEWQLGLIPRSGWVDKHPWRSAYFLFGILNTLILTVVVGTLALQRERKRLSHEVLVREIAERKRAEDALRSSKQLLKAVIDSAGVVIYAFDTNGRLILCNRQFETAIGSCRELVLGKRRDQFMPAATAAQHEANDHAVIVGSSMLEFEEENIEPDGVHTYFTVKCPVIENGALRAVVGVSTDITKKKHDEEKLRLAATIIATTAEGVVITDAAGTILSINRAFSEITGYMEDEALGRNPRILRSERHQPDFYQVLWTSLLKVGVWQGEIWNRRCNGEIFPEWLTITAIHDDAGRTTHYVGVFSDISSLKRSQDELEHLAHFDPLTDLPNRMLFQDRLNHAIGRAKRYEDRIAVLLLDLDGFKTINDSLGHPVGDHLLQEVAGRLKSCIRVEDTVARMGGDEFALILSNMKGGNDAIEVVHKLLSAIQIPVELFGHAARVTASIGIAVYPEDGDTVTDLVRNADAAMYSAKEAGRNAYRYYQSSMTQRAQERMLQERALRRAIENGEFEVWFQPQFGLSDGRLTGAEALVRWRDRERGLISPAQFIPLAESTGLIINIGDFVLQKVCTYARRWLDAGLDFGRLAINVAAPQIERQDFVGQLSAALAKAGVPPRFIEVEITESLLMENSDHARVIMLAIQALGVTIAIDDFGTGYSSLKYLKQLPIDNLKIDRAFVKDLPTDTNDVAITRAIISMAHSLGFSVIAEGIETENQKQFLRREGCNEGQGYLFNKPLSATDFEAWLAARSGYAQ